MIKTGDTVITIRGTVTLVVNMEFVGDDVEEIYVYHLANGESLTQDDIKKGEKNERKLN